MTKQSAVETELTPMVCQICFENKPMISKRKINNIKKRAKCHKTHLYCQDCIALHIQYKVQDKISTIQCPGDGCTMTLTPMAHRELIPPPVFVEWCDLLAESWVAKHSLMRAVCPSDACSEVVIDECRSSKAAREQCPKCKLEFCFGCGQKWGDHDHQHSNCSYEERIFIGAARDWNFQRCPTCRFFVQRRDGCSIITCRCGTSFCYRCGSSDIYRCRCWRNLNRICCSFWLIMAIVCIIVIVHSAIKHTKLFR